MDIACFDLEGVLVPEIWINVAARTGIDELRLTTRDIADYDELMRHRLRVLDEHDIKITDIQQVIAGLRPLPGALEFLAWVRREFQLVILSDTFYEFAQPLMAQLGHPLLLAHRLDIDEHGRVAGYRLRLPDQKRRGVEAFQSLNFRVAAVGDSYNDTAMLLAADKGILFRPPASLVEQFPGLTVVEGYDELARELLAD